jgi:hypothetical protein
MKDSLEIPLKDHASGPAKHRQRILWLGRHDEIHSACQATLDRSVWERGRRKPEEDERFVEAVKVGVILDVV